MPELRVGQHIVIFDDVDEPLVSRYKWTVRKGANTSYAHSTRHGLSMHRLILGLPVGHIVDHINFNGLDNRRDNLRFCNTQESVWHTRGWAKEKRTHKCPYKGVWPVVRCTGAKGGKLWEAKIGLNGKQIYIGSYKTAEIAAMAYDDYARYYHGRFAHLNFPSASPKIKRAA